METHPGPLDYLLNLPRFSDRGGAAYRPGLERIRALLQGMGEPHRAYRICHVGGTNGKGSTASMIAAILTTSGVRTGLHTSPHLLHVAERMRVDGSPATESWLIEAVERHIALFERVEPSFFEATVALSLLYFAEQRVDVAVVEVGLGGRLDATNIVEPEVCVITNIGLEHTDLLGSSIEQIAQEKAGVIKPGVPVVSGVGEPGSTVISRVAREQKSPMTTLHETDVEVIHEHDAGRGRYRLRTTARDYGLIELDLPGAHQIDNATIAVVAAEHLLPELDAAIVRSALANIRTRSGLRGRLEEVGGAPPVIVDVAHNADGIGVAMAYAAGKAGGGRAGIVLALMGDKDVDAVADRLEPYDPLIRTVPIRSDRAIPAEELSRKLRQHDLRADVAGGLDEALDELRGCAIILVVGSHLLAADALARLG